MSLANDLIKQSKSTLVAQVSSCGRKPKFVDENGNPESAASIGRRYGCSGGKVQWLFNRYKTAAEVYEVIGRDARADNKSNQYTKSLDLMI